MPKSQSERMADYRARIRADPDKWAAHLEAQRDYKRDYYKTKLKKGEAFKLQNKLRTRRYRQRKKFEKESNYLPFVKNEAADEAAGGSSSQNYESRDDPLCNFTHFKKEPQFPMNEYGSTADESTTSASLMSQSVQTEENDMLTFFKSLLPDCYKLDERRKRLYKFEMLKRLNEHLDQQEKVSHCEAEFESSTNLSDVTVDVKPPLV